MCVYSMIMDHRIDKWQKWIEPTSVPPFTTLPYVQPPSFPTDQELQEFRDLLDRAREYDKKNNEPDCESASKKQKLLDLAKELGVEINFL